MLLLLTVSTPSFSSANETSRADTDWIEIDAATQKQNLADCKKLLADCASITKRQQDKLDEFMAERGVREQLIEAQQVSLENESKKNETLKKVVTIESVLLGLLAILKFAPLL
jgi:hypothetical protein